MRSHIALIGDVRRSIFATALILILILSLIAPSHVTAQEIPKKVAKYVENGESITHVLNLAYNDTRFNITVYELSSGKVLIYSPYYDAVVLGDEWMGLEDGDRIALQLFSLYAFEKLKPLKEDELATFLNEASYWEKGAEIADKYKNFRLAEISILKIGASVMIWLIAPPAGPLATFAFIAGTGAELTSTLSSFIKKFKLSEKNAPKAFLEMALMPKRSDKEYELFYKTLNSLSDNKSVSELRNLSEGVKAVSRGSALGEYSFLMLFTFSASNEKMLEALESKFGRDLVEKAGAFFVTSGDEGAFHNLAVTMKDAWAGVPGAREKLSDIMAGKAVSDLKNLAVGLIIDAATNWIIRSSEDVDNLMASHAVHSLLARDLARCLFDHGSKMQFALTIESGTTKSKIYRATPPTLNNMESFFYYKYLLYILLEDYYRGMSKLSPELLYNTPEDLKKFWGSEKGIGPGLFPSLCSYNSQRANETLEDGLNYTLSVFKMFEEFRGDMGHRRRAPGPAKGINAFLVIDVSGSMSEEFRGARKIDAAKKAAKDFVNLVSPHDRVGLVKFSSTAELVAELAEDKQDLLKAIDALSPGGATALGDGLWLALDRLEAGGEERARAVILLTDGMNNAGTHTPREAAERAKSLGIPVYTLGYGEKGKIDEETLREIARITGGSYFYAPSPQDLRGLYANLSQLVSGHLVSETLIGKIKAGESKSFSVDVGAGLPYFSVRVSYSGSILYLSATRPDGVDVSGVESNVIYTEGPGFIQLMIYRPMSGKWLLRIVGVETPADGTDYTAAVALPPISTDPHELVFEMRPGDKNTNRIRVRALRSLPSLEVEVSPTLKGIITASSSTFGNLAEGQEVEIGITAEVPDTATGSVSGTLVLRTLDSVIFIPITVIAKGVLRHSVMINSSVLYEGESAKLTIAVLNDAGDYITGATVGVLVDGMSMKAEEVGGGIYELTIANLRPSSHMVKVYIEKEGYPSVTSVHRLLVTLLGDVNADGAVDYRDIALVVASYGSPTIKAKPRTDINRDGIVDYRDLAVVVANYGRSA